MIISDKYKYVFVELPRTGSTAINKELIENYSGEEILHKHATYREFLKSATEEQKKYIVFSCIRNPIDRTVSLYFKMYAGLYDYKYQKKEKTLYEKYYLLPKLNFIKKGNVSFDEYLKKYYKFPYVDWSILDHKNFDHVIRFENLNNDFKNVLNNVGLKIKRDLPSKNVTASKGNYKDYLNSKSSNLYINTFGPTMKTLGYDMPLVNNNYKIPKIIWFKYYLIKFIKKLYWLYIKPLRI